MKKKALLIALVAGLSSGIFSIHAYAVSEGQAYAPTYAQEVMPYYESHGVSESFQGVDNIKISYRKFMNPHEKGALVILPGRSEPYYNYAEIVYDLRDSGYSIYLLDHRGQGYSDRLLPNRQLGYVASFSDYVTDLEYFMDHVVNSTPHTKRILLSHSMGGAIAALYMEAHPGAVDGAIFSSPMFQINTGGYNEFEVLALAESQILLNKGESYIPGNGDYKETPLSESLLTHSEDRWKREADMFSQHSELQVGGATFQWTFQGVLASMWARGRAAQIQAPLLILEAGKDPINVPVAEENFCAQAPHCKITKFANSFHEVLNEVDSIRTPALTEIKAFLAN